MASCGECRTAFQALEQSDPDANRATRLDRMQPECCCQNFSVSKHSPAPLDPDEILLRVLVAPQHMDKKGHPRAAALADAERNGLSMLRKGKATPDEIIRVASGLVEKARAAHGARAEKAGVFGVLEIPCATIRESQLESEATPGYCVYDTALQDLRCHTEAFQRVASTEVELIEARRKHLFARVRPTFVPVERFMGGLLRNLAPRLSGDSRIEPQRPDEKSTK